ncbi:MAG: YceI family protein [Zetaproteobacteria bacterium]|nr:YceI family protein [Zetaproteobacteria bacterium]
MKIKTILAAGLLSFGLSLPAQAVENYNFDIKGQHAFIQFKIKHLGYSWLIGNFNTFDGSFTYDAENPAFNSVNTTIDLASIDSNHSERDKHLRSGDFFDVANYPTATFKSTKFQSSGDGKGIMTGELTLHGVTQTITLDVQEIGGGKDPWGGFRRGFEGSTTLHLSDYKMVKGNMLGAPAENVEIFLSIEGIRQ